MKINPLLGLLFLVCLRAAAQTPAIPSREIQIKTALLAAPPAQRDGATVLGYDEKGTLVTLRAGTNNQICLADDPTRKGFSAACYHKDLEPFMARGRELRKEGKNAKQIFDLREAEAKAGKLPMPKGPTTLAVYDANDEDFNRATGEVKGKLRYVIYIPWATAESTGLPLKPEIPGGPWIMDAGTHRAHIMLNPTM
ncbi:MAG: hypothetical protein HZA93_22310 [Verrucomicrobia bacterium]|nr:hypothetical protein [Verrucomicrobiota bacterium]